MRILLISPPRTGSTSLVNSLSKSLNLNSYTIPQEYKYPNNFGFINHVMNTENVIFRTHIRINHGFTMEDFVNFFDYTLLLSRRNEDDHKISFANLYYKLIIEKKTDIHELYSKDSIPTSILQSEHFEKCYNDNILIEKQSIKKLSQNKNIPIIYYEDLYQSTNGPQLIKNLIPELDLDKFLHFISNTKKIRINLKKTII